MMGLVVVARLAARHGVRVELQPAHESRHRRRRCSCPAACWCPGRWPVAPTLRPASRPPAAPRARPRSLRSTPAPEASRPRWRWRAVRPAAAGTTTRADRATHPRRPRTAPRFRPATAAARPGTPAVRAVGYGGPGGGAAARGPGQWPRRGSGQRRLRRPAGPAVRQRQRSARPGLVRLHRREPAAGRRPARGLRSAGPRRSAAATGGTAAAPGGPASGASPTRVRPSRASSRPTRTASAARRAVPVGGPVPVVRASPTSRHPRRTGPRRPGHPRGRRSRTAARRACGASPPRWT